MRADRRAHVLMKSRVTYQFPILEGIEHLKVAAALETVEVRDVLPEAIHRRQVEQPLGVNLPCIPARKQSNRMLPTCSLNKKVGMFSFFPIEE